MQIAASEITQTAQEIDHSLFQSGIIQISRIRKTGQRFITCDGGVIHLNIGKYPGGIHHQSGALAALFPGCVILSVIGCGCRRSGGTFADRRTLSGTAGRRNHPSPPGRRGSLTGDIAGRYRSSRREFFGSAFHSAGGFCVT